MDSFNYCHYVLIYVCGAFDCIVEGGVVRWFLFCVLCVFVRVSYGGTVVVVVMVRGLNG